MFENYSKCPIWIFHLWHFPTIFVLSKVTCLATLTLFLRLSNTVNSFKIIKKVSILGSHCLKITQYVAFEFLNFSISHQFPSLFGRNFRLSKIRQTGPFIGIFTELLSTQNVTVARFTRNIKYDFFYDFQTIWNTESGFLKNIISGKWCSHF